MIQRGNFGLNLHFAGEWLGRGAVGDKVHIGGDGCCLFGNFKGIHEQSVTMLVRNIMQEVNVRTQNRIWY
jgi:hypothetical protein